MAVASIKKRNWATRKGEQHEAWALRYRDAEGKQRLETFNSQREAIARRAEITLAMRAGVHTPVTGKATLADAAQAWIERGKADSLERTTIRQREQHWDFHIAPLLGTQTRLGKLNRPMIEAFRDALLKSRSRAMAGKVLTSTKSMLKLAAEIGLLNHNPASAVTIGKAKRHQRRLKVGLDIPTRDEYRALIAAAMKPKVRALLHLAGRAGLRASELRALQWGHLHLGDKPRVTVSERADRWNVIGSPKSESSAREIPLGRATVTALQELFLTQGRPTGDRLVFGNGVGKIENLGNISQRWLGPVQKAAGVILDGKPKYSLHAFRHLCISTWIAEQTFDLKTIQVYAGHSSLQITLDRYAHFIPKEGDHARLDAADLQLFGSC
jgi:integrase